MLYRAELDGSNAISIAGGKIGYFCIYKDQIFYSNNHIYRCNLDGSGVYDMGTNGYELNACSGKVFYFNSDAEKNVTLYCMNTDGSNKQKVG